MGISKYVVLKRYITRDVGVCSPKKILTFRLYKVVSEAILDHSNHWFDMQVGHFLFLSPHWIKHCTHAHTHTHTNTHTHIYTHTCTRTTHAHVHVYTHTHTHTTHTCTLIAACCVCVLVFRAAGSIFVARNIVGNLLADIPSTLFHYLKWNFHPESLVNLEDLGTFGGDEFPKVSRRGGHFPWLNITQGSQHP